MASKSNKSIVSSFSVAFKKATIITEDTTEAKKEHRQHIKDLIEKYKEDVVAGKAEGIRTAKELVEVVKLDLLLMGEADSRTDNTSNPIDEAQVIKMTQMVDENSPEFQAILEQLYGALNDTNDELDTTPVSTPAGEGNVEVNNDKVEEE